MMKRLSIILICAGFLIVTGCAAVIIGAGVGAGAYAYIDGALKRSYPANYEKTYQVCIGVLSDLGQPIKNESTDGHQTTIEAERSDGTPMRIRVTILEPERTEVSIRTGVVGLWKKDISKQFHEFIEERLVKK
jgi:hypothetical protein